MPRHSSGYQTGNNHKGGDWGVCGPHMCALIEHILARRATLLDDPGLDASFNTEGVLAARTQEFGFNSNYTRTRLSDRFVEEPRKQEKYGTFFNSVDNLTPELLRIVSTAEGLGRFVQELATRRQSAPRPSGSGSGGGSGGGKGGGSGGGGGGKGGDDGSDDDSDDDGTYGDPPLTMSKLLEEIEGNPDVYIDMTEEDRLALAHGTIIE